MKLVFCRNYKIAAAKTSACYPMSGEKLKSK